MQLNLFRAEINQVNKHQIVANVAYCVETFFWRQRIISFYKYYGRVASRGKGKTRRAYY